MEIQQANLNPDLERAVAAHTLRLGGPASRQHFEDYEYFWPLIEALQRMFATFSDLYSQLLRDEPQQEIDASSSLVYTRYVANRGINAIAFATQCQA